MNRTPFCLRREPFGREGIGSVRSADGLFPAERNRIAREEITFFLRKYREERNQFSSECSLTGSNRYHAEEGSFNLKKTLERGGQFLPKKVLCR